MRGTSAPPSPGYWNIALTQGGQSHRDLISDMGTGLLEERLDDRGDDHTRIPGIIHAGRPGFGWKMVRLPIRLMNARLLVTCWSMLMRIVPGNDARTHTVCGWFPHC